ncbi:LuxR C-terminal-related transcriptional regulator [Actinoplanes sp. NEAU-A12]|uniref:LuxR C-terminal-related transcriptional regulator n=1 Tax=Actinoplanes sandaracinus TaxID=3045177 RepID=A0ABT6X1W6_9ACTN|nr:LuxR C-terminal-related transcriptional regulator [Actinoplanes sandaracinus]MDI6105998.1 LuxR C-terminal-related transcriptional regulator [Actinoplanes sandaracinus]
MQEELQPDAVAIFRSIVADPSWTRETIERRHQISAERVDEIIDSLARLMLLRPSLDPAREYDPVSPEAAVIELLAEEERQVRQQQAQLARVRSSMLSLQQTYFEARQQRRPTEAIDIIQDRDMIRHLLADRARRTEKELRIAHPGSGMNEEGLARSRALDLLMLERGVEMRSVLQHSTRNHRPTRRYVAEVVRCGAIVRTVPVVPRRLIIFDRDIAFIPREGGDSAQGAVLIREPSVIDHLLSSFDALWEDGRAYPIDVDEDEADVIRDEIAQAILEQMAGGAKDELIARRLGISVRTCRRYIATITTSLGAQSRFQAGVLAAQRGLLR